MEQPAVFGTQVPKNDNFKKFDIPVKWGLIIGILSCVMTTVNYMFLVDNYIIFLVTIFLSFVLTVILYGVTGAQQRKAMGGYITFKEAFQAIFVAILISVIISSIYGVIYTIWIDPDITQNVKAGTLRFLEQMNMPEDKINEKAAEMDKQVADGFKPAVLAQGIALSIVMHSLFGMICAAIVKRKRPEIV